jgi:hypothetical protein
MPRTSKLSILAGGSVLCVAAVTSMTAITCPAAASAATVPQSPLTGPASMTQARSTVPSASLLSGSLVAASLTAAPVSAAHPSAAANAAQWAASYQAQEAAVLKAATIAIAAWGHAFLLADIRASALNAGDTRLVRARQAAARTEARADARAQARAEALRAMAAYAASRAAAAHAAAIRLSAARQAARRAASAQPSPAPATGLSSGPSSWSGSPRQIAQRMLEADGQGSQFACLNSLWQAESGWNVYAQNPGTGAYGIPQALPGRKMATAGPGWQSSAATQIAWGLSYINATYGSPCAAWSHEQSVGWY